MPSIPRQPTDLMTLATADILNAISTEVGGNYAARVGHVYTVGATMPNGNTATAADALASLRGMGNVITSYQPFANKFIDTLINRIGMVYIQAATYKNPLRIFKRGTLDLGETIEEIFVDIANVYNYNPDDNGAGLFKNYKPNISAVFHYVNYKVYYPISVKREDLTAAFTSFNGVQELITKIIESVYTAASYDEYIVTKYMLARNIVDGNVRMMLAGDGTVNAISTAFILAGRKMQHMSKNFNEMGVVNNCKYSNMVTLIDSDSATMIDVEMMSAAFHMEKLELVGRQVDVDGFANHDYNRLSQLFANDPNNVYKEFTQKEISLLERVNGIVCDEKFFMIFDNLTSMEEAPADGVSLRRNYFYHVWKVFSLSPFAQACVILSPDGNNARTGYYPLVTDDNA